MNEQREESESILNGLDNLIDKWLGIDGDARFGTAGSPAFHSKTAAIALSSNGGPLGQPASRSVADPLIPKLLDRIDANWKSLGSQRRSSANWVLRKALNLNAESNSPEKVLEKTIVRLLDGTWFNQIPTCSGMAQREEGKRSIDLGHDLGNNAFEFIELKYGSAEQNFGVNHPLYAAFEILQYGLLFAHARAEGLCPEGTLRNAKAIHLRVLAPSGYYRYKERGGDTKRFEFGWLEAAINSGLGPLKSPVKFDFCFQEFTTAFDAIYGHPGLPPEGERAFQVSGLQARELVYGNPH
jgi:hypothetical protein